MNGITNITGIRLYQCQSNVSVNVKKKRVSAMTLMSHTAIRHKEDLTDIQLSLFLWLLITLSDTENLMIWIWIEQDNINIFKWHYMCFCFKWFQFPFISLSSFFMLMQLQILKVFSIGIFFFSWRLEKVQFFHCGGINAGTKSIQIGFTQDQALQGKTEVFQFISLGVVRFRIGSPWKTTPACKREVEPDPTFEKIEPHVTLPKPIRHLQ